MKATTLGLGLSLALTGVFSPIAALAQPAPPPPTGPTPAPQPGPAAEVAPAAPADAPPPAPAPEPTPVVAAPMPPDDAGKQPPPPPAAPEPPPAEETAPVSTVSGYVEAGYDHNLTWNSQARLSPLRAYDQAGGFKLRNANLKVGHAFTDQASAYMSLDFGVDAIYNSGLDFATVPSAAGVPVAIREGYAKWTPGDLTLTFGKFVTTMGIEVVDGYANPTITRGYLYWLAEPVSHTGAKALYALAGGVAHIGIGVANGWDVVVDNNNKKTILFNADVAPSEMFRVQLSGTYGQEVTANDDDARLNLDLTGALVFDSLTLNFQGLYGNEQRTGAETDKWFGFGLQPYFVADMFSLGARIEYFSNKFDTRTLFAGGDGTITDIGLLNFTITPGITPAKGFTIRGEFRADTVLAAKVAGVDDKNLFYGGSTYTTLSLGAHYVF